MLEGKFLNDVAKILLITLVLAVGCLAPATIMAKSGDNRDRQRFYGWVEAMPAGLHGTWIIGGRQVTTNPRGPSSISRRAPWWSAPASRSISAVVSSMKSTANRPITAADCPQGKNSP